VITYERPYYYDAVKRAGCYPLDQQLGLTGALSEGVMRMMVKLAARLSYRETEEVFEELTGVSVSLGQIWELVQSVGKRSRPALEPLATLKGSLESAACVGIGMDGFMVNIDHEGWKEVKIGTVFEAHPDPSPESNLVQESVRASSQSYVMHLGSPEGFGFKLAVEAQSRQWSQAAQSAVLGDGAAWIWNLAANDYASAAHIVDWYHAKQHLWAVAELLYPNQPEQAAAWVKKHATLLYDGHADQLAQLVTAYATAAPPDRQAALATEAGYFASNHERMQYRDFRSAHLPIGSGTVESAAKQAKHRLCGAGMRWSRSGLENILPLRAAVMSETFDLLWPRICPRA